MPGPDQAVAEAQIQTPDKPVAPKPVEKPEQPLGQTEAEMVKTIDSLGDGHTTDPHRTFSAIIDIPISEDKVNISNAQPDKATQLNATNQRKDRALGSLWSWAKGKQSHADTKDVGFREPPNKADPNKPKQDDGSSANDPLDYLKRKLEPEKAPLSRWEVKDKLAALFIPLGKVDYTKSGGQEVSVSNGEATINFAFSETLEGLPPDIQEDFRVETESGFRRLDSLALTKDGKTLDFSKLVPDGTVIFFNPFRPGAAVVNDGELENRSSAFPDSKVILISGDPASIGTVMVALHENGHLIDESTIRALYDARDVQESASRIPGNIKNRIDIQTKADALMLKSERNAWAYALQQIRPFVKGDSILTKEPIDTLVHGRCLKSYSSGIRAGLSSMALNK